MSRGIEAFSLRGKSVLVTGASGHLGSAISRVLGEAGAHVLVNSRSAARGIELTKWLRDIGCSAEPAVFDVTDHAAVATYFSARKDKPLDVLINNAYLGGAGNIELAEAESYAGSYEVTVLAAHNLVKVVLPGLRLAVEKNGYASVINLASMYALVSPDQRIYDGPGVVNPPFYGAAKAALLQWTRFRLGLSLPRRSRGAIRISFKSWSKRSRWPVLASRMRWPALFFFSPLPPLRL